MDFIYIAHFSKFKEVSKLKLVSVFVNECFDVYVCRCVFLMCVGMYRLLSIYYLSSCIRQSTFISFFLLSLCLCFSALRLLLWRSVPVCVKAAGFYFNYS